MVDEASTAGGKKHHVFSEDPQFGSLRPLPNTDLEKSKTAMIPDEKSHGLGTQRESCDGKVAYF